MLGSSLLLVIGGFLGLTAAGRWWGLIGLYSFTASYSTSLGALVWVLVSEVRTTRTCCLFLVVGGVGGVALLGRRG